MKINSHLSEKIQEINKFNDVNVFNRSNFKVLMWLAFGRPPWVTDEGNLHMEVINLESVRT